MTKNLQTNMKTENVHITNLFKYSNKQYFNLIKILPVKLIQVQPVRKQSDHLLMLTPNILVQYYLFYNVLHNKAAVVFLFICLNSLRYNNNNKNAKLI